MESDDDDSSSEDDFFASSKPKAPVKPAPQEVIETAVVAGA
jgi:hypothetical protein